MPLGGLLEIYWRWLGVAVVGDFGIEDSGGEWLKGDTELDCDGRGMRPRNTGVRGCGSGTSCCLEGRR